MVSINDVASTSLGELTRAVGGGIKNRLWNKIKADVLKNPIDVLQFQETGKLLLWPELEQEFTNPLKRPAT